MRLSTGLPTRGLLGDNDGDPANDLVSAHGVPVPELWGEYRFIHGEYANSWRIQDESSLFTYASGQGTADFTQVAFPAGSVSVADFPAEEVEDATIACEGAAEGTARDACVLDRLVTGGDTFLDDALQHGSAPVSAAKARFSEAGTLGVDFESTVPVNFASTRRGHDAVVGGFAGPYKSGGEYAFAVPVHHAHDRVDVAFDLIVIGTMTQARARTVELSLGHTQDIVRVARAGAVAEHGSISRITDGSLADGRPFVRYRYTASSTSVGRAFRGSILAQGFSRGQQDSVAIDNVALALANATTPAPQALSIGDVVVPTSDGERGVIETPGGRDAYTFTVAPGQGSLWLEHLTRPDLTFGCHEWQLVRLADQTELDACFDNQVLTPGEYRLEIAPREDAEYPYRYGFILHGPQAPDTIQATVGATPVELGEATGDGAGVIEGRDGWDEYRLDLTQAGTLNIRIDCLEADDPACVENVWLNTHLRWLGRTAAVDVQAGPQTLSLFSDPGLHRYRLTLWIDQPVAQHLQMGDVIAPQGSADPGRLTETDLLDRYTFTVPSGGARVTLQHSPRLPGWSTDPRFPHIHKRVCQAWLLYQPGSQEHASEGCLEGRSLEAGTYVLDVLPPPGQPLPYEYGFELYLTDAVLTQQFAHALPADVPLEITPNSSTGEGVLASMFHGPTGWAAGLGAAAAGWLGRE